MNRNPHIESLSLPYDDTTLSADRVREDKLVPGLKEMAGRQQSAS